MVQINVSQLLKLPIGSTRRYTVDEKVDIIDSNVHVLGEIELMRTDRGILIRGNLNSETEVTCCRCLNLYSCPLVLNIEEEYFPTTDIVTGSSIPVSDEPGCFTIDEHNIMDLSEAIRQYTLLAIPMKPLCREDCAGLCPACGCNLNQVQCDCESRSVDPRWAKLKKLISVTDQVSINIHEGTK